MRPQEYTGPTVNKSEDDLPSRPRPPELSLRQALTAALERAQTAHGGKNLACFFDGRDGKAVAKSTVSRWIGEADRFPALFLPVLVQLDPEFGRYLLRMAAVWHGIDERAVKLMPPKAAAEYQRACEKTILAEYSPGRWGR